MKTRYIFAAAGAIALAATPAIARTIVAGPFENRGQCHAWLPWQHGEETKGWGRYVPEGPYRLVCREIEGDWYVVYE